MPRRSVWMLFILVIFLAGGLPNLILPREEAVAAVRSSRGRTPTRQKVRPKRKPRQKPSNDSTQYMQQGGVGGVIPVSVIPVDANNKPITTGVPYNSVLYAQVIRNTGTGRFKDDPVEPEDPEDPSDDAPGWVFVEAWIAKKPEKPGENRVFTRHGRHTIYFNAEKASEFSRIDKKWKKIDKAYVGGDLMLVAYSWRFNKKHLDPDDPEKRAKIRTVFAPILIPIK